MIYFNAFIFSGLVCMISQVILDNTKLTSGHITAGLTVVGVILSFFGCYNKIIDLCGYGAITLIINFGHSLYDAGIIAYKSYGVIGIFQGLLTKSSLIITITIFFSFIISLFFKAKD